MKNLKQTIQEKLVINKDIKSQNQISQDEMSKDIEKALEDFAWGGLDYLNQEGVVDWDEKKLIKYVNGDEEPDFKYLVNLMIEEIKKNGEPRKIKLLPILKKYETEEWKDSINVAILRAMQDYVKDIM